MTFVDVLFKIFAKKLQKTITLSICKLNTKINLSSTFEKRPLIDFSQSGCLHMSKIRIIKIGIPQYLQHTLLTTQNILAIQKHLTDLHA